MRLSEQEFLNLLSKKKVTRIILPVRLPTWNALLAMDYHQRKKARHAIHDLIALVVSTSITKESDLQTQTVFRLKQPLMESFLQEYYKTITPRSSTKYHSRKKSANLKKR